LTTYRNAVTASLGLVLMYLAYGMVPTFCFRFLDRVDDILLRSKRSIATYMYCKAIEVFRGQASRVELEISHMNRVAKAEMSQHAASAIHSILRMREEYRKRLLEEGCSTLERLLIERGIL